MISELDDIKIDEPLIQVLMHEHIENLRKRKSTSLNAALIQKRWESESDFYNSARMALVQAIIFSTLAGTAAHQEDFEREALILEPVDDVDISDLRCAVFNAGVRCVVESIGNETAKELKISDRVDCFHRQTSRIDPSR